MTSSLAYRVARKVYRAFVSASQPLQAGWPLPQTTVKSLNQLFYQQRLMAKLAELRGDIVECGVGTGETLHYWCALVEQEGKGRHIWGFDSFEGFPEPSPQDTSDRQPRKGEWNRTSLVGMLDFLERAGWASAWLGTRVTLVKGFFSETLPYYRGDGIALLHADVDLYQSYIDVLTHLYPQVVPGGIIAFDEYMGTHDHAKWPGARQAIDEFLGPLGVRLQRDVATSKYYAVKPR